MIIVGLILLFPGLCTLFFTAESLVEGTFGFSGDLVSLVVIGVLTGLAGIGVLLIRLAIRGPRP